LAHINCSYELITEKHRSKATVKIVLKHTILYIHYVNILMCSPTKLNFRFYDFCAIYYDFFKYSAKINKGFTIVYPVPVRMDRKLLL
jgi:hypothetical protein